ncbi:MAG: type I-F CRISPR-associated endoribonuclease Cas6/Csy4 [Thiotrichales bacterium]|nr:type I-F CRISPR-associated endoribonuclease Cas6/Csy4 [Thiotrichales bacterium]
MKHYIELTLLPNTDINAFTLWSKTYQQLHLGLVEVQDANKQVPIGLSFPEYHMGEKFDVLGSKLRLFSKEEATLAKFDATKWLSPLSDYVHCTGIRPVPEKLKGYANYRRIQPKTGKERLARRYAKRHNMNFETAFNTPLELSVKSDNKLGYEKKMLRYAELPEPNITLPFIHLKSLSSGEDFCLWIQKTEASELMEATFTRYGLSPKATVPEF